MIGNDIVDFEQALRDSNWQRKGWLDKLFNQREQQLIMTSEWSERYVWVLWSMKEAAYKAHQRRYALVPRFNPKDFECVLGSDFQNQRSVIGWVTIESIKYPTVSYITHEYVHSIAKLEGYKIIVNQITSGTRSNTAFSEIAPQLPGYQHGLYSLKKDTLRIPHIYTADKPTDFLISMSHHGCYGGCLVGYLC